MFQIRLVNPKPGQDVSEPGAVVMGSVFKLRLDRVATARRSDTYCAPTGRRNFFKPDPGVARPAVAYPWLNSATATRLIVPYGRDVLINLSGKPKPGSGLRSLRFAALQVFVP